MGDLAVRLAVASSCVTIGCGRIGFEPTDALAVNPITPGPLVRVTSALGQSTRPSLVWNGRGYSLAWVDDRGGTGATYFVRLDDRGAAQTPQVPEPGDGIQPVLAWRDTEHFIVNSSNRTANNEIWIARVDLSGATIAETQVTNAPLDSINANVVWTGTEVAVTWDDKRDGNAEIYLARLSAAGTMLGSNVRLTSTSSDSRRASIAWTGSELVIAWDELVMPLPIGGNDEIFLARVAADGTPIAQMQITEDPNASQRPIVLATGTGLGLFWDDRRDDAFEVYFARLDASGAKLGSDVRVTDGIGTSLNASCVWTGWMYGVVWEDDRDGNREIYFIRLDADGNQLEMPARITTAAGISSRPSLSWNGREFAVAWQDARDGNDEIYFQILTP